MSLFQVGSTVCTTNKATCWGKELSVWKSMHCNVHTPFHKELLQVSTKSTTQLSFIPFLQNSSPLPAPHFFQFFWDKQATVRSKACLHMHAPTIIFTIWDKKAMTPSAHPHPQLPEALEVVDSPDTLRMEDLLTILECDSCSFKERALPLELL